MMAHSAEEIHTALRDALAFVNGEPAVPGREDALLRMFAEEVIRLTDECHRLTTALRQIAIGDVTAITTARAALASNRESSP